MRRLRTLPFLRHNRAVSYTVSAIIMTAVTISLVLAAFFYAYQVLDRQRGQSEFEVAKKSFLAFNDALENVAWKPGAVRSTRFTAEYGYLQLIPKTNTITINVTVNGVKNSLAFPGGTSVSTGIIKYWISTNYVTYEPGYESYILGNSSSIISGSTDSYGRAAVRQQTGFVTVTLDYRVRVMRTAVVNINGIQTNYVDIWVIKVSNLVSTQWSYIHDFDLQAKTLSVQTSSKSFTGVTSGTTSVSVQIGSAPVQQVPIALVVPGSVVFNVIVADVQVGV